MGVISGARALRHPLPNGRRAPCRQQRETSQSSV
jgi:hypothetical protein